MRCNKTRPNTNVVQVQRVFSFLTWKATVKAFNLKYVGGVGHGLGMTSTIEGMPVSISACARLTAICTPPRPSLTTHPSPRRMPRTSGLSKFGWRARDRESPFVQR